MTQRSGGNRILHADVFVQKARTSLAHNVFGPAARSLWAVIVTLCFPFIFVLLLPFSYLLLTLFFNFEKQGSPRLGRTVRPAVTGLVTGSGHLSLCRAGICATTIVAWSSRRRIQAGNSSLRLHAVWEAKKRMLSLLL